MPMPSIGSFAQGLYDRLRPMAYADATHSWSLAAWLGGIGTMFQKIDDYAADTDDGPGWSQIVDINRAPAEGLPWLAQFVGVTVDPHLSIADQRARIKGTDGWNRGKPSAIIAAAQQYLTGGKNVLLRERDAVASPSDPAYGLTVITYTSQTPSSAKVLAAITAQKPAGIILNYQVLAGQDYRAIRDSGMTYADLRATYATYNGVRQGTPGS